MSVPSRHYIAQDLQGVASSAYGHQILANFQTTPRAAEARRTSTEVSPAASALRAILVEYDFLKYKIDVNKELAAPFFSCWGHLGEFRTWYLTVVTLSKIPLYIYRVFQRNWHQSMCPTENAGQSWIDSQKIKTSVMLRKMSAKSSETWASNDLWRRIVKNSFKLSFKHRSRKPNNFRK